MNIDMSLELSILSIIFLLYLGLLEVKLDLNPSVIHLSTRKSNSFLKENLRKVKYVLSK